MSKGRGNANAITIKEAIRLDINNLIRGKHIQQKKKIDFISSWSTGDKVKIQSVSNDKEMYLRFMYTQTNKATKEIKEYDYKIYIVGVKSNLGIGANHYFICPELGIKCKILYLCYGAERFKCRKAYNRRIYYGSQLRAKDYKGKPTKRKLRLTKLFEKKIKLREIKEKQFEVWLNKYLGLNS
jgi:hypothetical protein